MLDTWRPGRKQRIRSAHIMAAERIRQEFQNAPPQKFHDDPVTPEQREKMRLYRFHTIQADLWGKSIAEFGDDDI